MIENERPTDPKLSTFIVTEKAKRPALPDDHCCFYCRRPIGEPHDSECVLILRRVIVRMTVEYPVFEPAYHGKHEIEFHRNDASWCADNALDELGELFTGKDPTSPCMCNYAKFEYVRDDGKPFLREDSDKGPEL